jgi:hypothetical protein
MLLPTPPTDAPFCLAKCLDGLHESNVRAVAGDVLTETNGCLGTAAMK